MSVFHNNALIGSGGGAGAAAGEVATKSLRFNAADASHLSRTPSSAGNRKTFTVSCWVKRAAFSAHNHLLQTGNNYFRFQNSDEVIFYSSGSDAVYTTAKFRDPSAWYHVVLAVDTTQSTAANRVKIYVNGTQHTLTGTQPSQNADLAINNNAVHYIGSAGTSSSEALNGYLADYYLIDGSQLAPTSFGAYDDNGVWQAAAYSGTYGTNGFHLAFDNASLGTDSSGNDNTFTVNNITANKASVSTGTITNVAAGNAWNQDKTWSNLVSGPSQGYVGSNPITNGFDGSNSTLANASSAGGTMTFSAALGTGTFNVEMRFGNDQLYNGTTIDGVSPTSTSVSNTIGHWTGLTSFNVMTMNSTGLANNARCCWNWIKVNGKFLVDSGNSGDPGGGPPDLTIANTTNFDQLAVHDKVQTNVSITAIDSSTSKISVSGGSWEGSNGSGTSGGDTTVTTVAVTNGDDVFDVPTNGSQSDTGAGGEVSGNYATLNPAFGTVTGSTNSPENGNLTVDGSSSANFSPTTIPVTSGKWYVEVTVAGSGNSSTVGIWKMPMTYGTNYYQNENYRYYQQDGNIYNESGATSTSYNTYAAGDVIGIALDMDNGKVFFSKNGTFQGSSVPASGTNPAASGLSGTWAIALQAGASTSHTLHLNAGQKSYSYSAPTGFKALCTTNLPTPTIADGSDHFDIQTYTGTGASQTLGGLSFAADFFWRKCRSASQYHNLVDSLRGLSNSLISNGAFTEQTGQSNISNITSTGYDIGTEGAINTNGETYVAWNWNAGANSNKTYTVKVVSDSGNKYRFDDHGSSAVTLDLAEGSTYIFDQSDSSNSGHPLRFSTTSDGTHGSGSEYTTGVTATGTPGSAGAKTTIVVAASAPTLYYYCSSHSGMGGQVNTNSTAGSTRLSGSENAVAYDQSATWSNVTTLSGGSTASGKPLTNGFDGSLSTATEGDSSNEYAEIAISTTVAAGGVRVYAAVTSSNPLVINLYNGGSNVETVSQGASGAQWYATSSYSGPITKIRIERTGRAFEWMAVEVNGKILVDSNVTPATPVPSINSVVKANPGAGFSIVTWTASAAGSRIAHGLNAAPEMIIARSRTTTQPWVIYHSAFGKGGVLQLHVTDAVNTTYPTYWGNNEPNSGVFDVYTGQTPWANNAGDMVAYCFSSVSNYSFVGSYEGNGSTDGPFVALSFAPKFILLKNADVSTTGHDWFIHDTKRDPFNVSDSYIKTSTADAEATYDMLDFLSNGFKIRTNLTSYNGNGNTHTFVAFAENPFQANGGLAR